MLLDQNVPSGPAIQISKHRNRTSYKLGNYRIDTERRSSGNGVYSRRQSWTNVVIWHTEFKGSNRDCNSLVQAVNLIHSGRCRFYTS